jgi:hypothetical protein
MYCVFRSVLQPKSAPAQVQCKLRQLTAAQRADVQRRDQHVGL